MTIKVKRLTQECSKVEAKLVERIICSNDPLFAGVDEVKLVVDSGRADVFLSFEHVDMKVTNEFMLKTAETLRNELGVFGYLSHFASERPGQVALLFGIVEERRMLKSKLGLR